MEFFSPLENLDLTDYRHVHVTISASVCKRLDAVQLEFALTLSQSWLPLTISSAAPTRLTPACRAISTEKTSAASPLQDFSTALIAKKRSPAEAPNDGQWR